MTESNAASNLFAGIEMGVGTWAWGDRLTWGYGRGYGLADLRSAFETALARGIVLFDTAEAYGQGQSESILGGFLKTAQPRPLVATKFMPYPWRLTRASLLKAIKGSLQRLGLEQVDLYQMHMPLPPVSIENWMGAMAEATQTGLTRAVGVSNYDLAQTQAAYDILAREGGALAANQVEYNLLNRRIERNGLLARCHELGVTVIAYSPLAMGALTGKYSADAPLQGFRSGRYGRRVLEKAEPLLTLMKRIGAEHNGKTPAQVALNWTIRKGTLPIPGAKTQRQAEQNAEALGWALTEDEMAALDEMSTRVTAEP